MDEKDEYEQVVKKYMKWFLDKMKEDQVENATVFDILMNIFACQALELKMEQKKFNNLLKMLKRGYSYHGV